MFVGYALITIHKGLEIMLVNVVELLLAIVQGVNDQVRAAMLNYANKLPKHQYMRKRRNY
jgi:hypothetical protein